MKIHHYLIISVIGLISCQNDTTMSHQNIAIGTYTKKEGHVDGKGEGIYLLKMNTLNGELTKVNTITGIINPSYVQVRDNYIYAVSELADNSGQPVGKLHRVDLQDHANHESILIGGNAPCHLAFLENSNHIVSSNYVNSISLIDINESLQLKDVVFPKGDVQGPPRQESPHPHMSIIAPDKQSLLVTDLGLDAIIQFDYRLGQLVELSRTPTTPQSGPRHMTVDYDNSIVYVLNELNHTIESFQWSKSGEPMERISTISTLADGIRNPNVNCSAIKLHPTGKYIYAGNRGINGDLEQSISAFKVNEPGKLTFIDTYSTKGEIPRDFAISPDGKFLLAANQNSDNIISFAIASDGSLTDTGHEFKINTPVCIKFY